MLGNVTVNFMSTEDGVWGIWSNWGTCSATCNNGTQTRDRVCTWPSSNHGKNCTGASTETQTCSPNPCPGNVTQVQKSVRGNERYVHCNTLFRNYSIDWMIYSKGLILVNFFIFYDSHSLTNWRFRSVLLIKLTLTRSSNVNFRYDPFIIRS